MSSNPTLTDAMQLIALGIVFEIHIPGRTAAIRVEPTNAGTGRAHRLLANHPECKLVPLERPSLAVIDGTVKPRYRRVRAVA